jgi:hypothetical protein
MTVRDIGRIKEIEIAAVDQAYKLQKAESAATEYKHCRSTSALTNVPKDQISVAVFQGRLKSASGLLHIAAPIGAPCFAYLESKWYVPPKSAS